MAEGRRAFPAPADASHAAASGDTWVFRAFPSSPGASSSRRCLLPRLTVMRPPRLASRSGSEALFCCNPI